MYKITEIDKLTVKKRLYIYLNLYLNILLNTNYHLNKNSTRLS